MRCRGFVSTWLAPTVLYLALVAAPFAPLLGCLGDCYVDLEAVHPGTGALELADTRLNTWILAWVQHALLTGPLGLFDANAFHPATKSLAGSEHLIGLALPTLPLHLLTSNAVLIYQLTLLLTGWLLAMTTFALVRWLSGCFWVSLAGGVFALVMPWRFAQLSHVQLLGAHWFPLIWLLGLRLLLGEGRRGDAAWLALVLSLQLLTSYYLAYQLALTLAILVGTVALSGALRPRGLLPFGLAAAASVLLLVLASLPYLAREGLGELPEQSRLVRQAGLLEVARLARLLAPRLPGLRDGAHGYWIPLSLGLLSLLAAAFAFGRGRLAGALGSRERVGVLFLWACVLSAIVMMLGPSFRAGELTLPLPYGWAAWLLPGFDNLRTPLRWGVTIGLAVPVLAALGLRVVAAWRSRPIARGAPALGLAALVLLAIDLPWQRPLPTTPAWEDPERVRDLYGALRALPSGPVLELPWPVDPLPSIGPDTRYMLASTLHWRPILNGFTAYLPPSVHFLRRLARRLPNADAIEDLARLTELRWIVVHVRQRNRWRAAEARGLLRGVYEDERSAIFEVPLRKSAGVWQADLVSPREDRTLTGLSRAPLDLPDAAGQLEVLAPPRLRTLAFSPLRQPLRLRISNDSDLDWPSFDPWNEGLVGLRVELSNADDGVLGVQVVPLDVDVPARARVLAEPLILSPERPGSHHLRLDLVQVIDGTWRVLPVPALEMEVEVREVRLLSRSPERRAMPLEEPGRGRPQ